MAEIRRTSGRTESDSSVTTREAISRMAIDLFERKGFRGTSMTDIAAAWGVSKPTLYHYFRSKSELLEFAYTSVSKGVNAVVESASVGDVAPDQRLRELIRTMTVYHVRERTFLAVFWRERHEIDPKVLNIVRRNENKLAETLRGLIRDGIKAGRFRHGEVEITATSVLALLSTPYRWATHVDATPEAVGDLIADLVLSGLDKR